MVSTQTIFVDLQRLYNSGEDAILIIQLMRAADDIALANWGLGYFKKEKRRTRLHVRPGAGRYFIRLQCGHLVEALKLIEIFKDRARLINLVTRCSNHTQESYQRLLEVLPEGSRRKQFEKWILPIRNRLVFHYDPSLVERALKKRISNPAGRQATITRGSQMDLSRFGVADDIEDTIVCRELWKIPPQDNVRAEANKRADFGSNLCRDFLHFVGEVAYRYIKEHAALGEFNFKVHHIKL